MTTTSTERSATRGEVAVCEHHRRSGLYLRTWSTPAVNRWFPEYQVTVTFLHPGWAVADWYAGVNNECLVYDTQAEAEAEADRRQAVECEARDGERLPDATAERCDCGTWPPTLVAGHHPDCSIYD